MSQEDLIKKRFKEKAQQEPEKHYSVRILNEEGFTRSQCSNCKNYFWASEDADVCGEPDCRGGYTFIGDTPARKKMDFIDTWKNFSKLFKKLGYSPIPRYPVVARWRDDAEFVQASIYDFQPYCVTGEVDPPANPLVVPQFCLRFNDTDNVGITGRHYTGFVMIGQHAFERPENYKPNDYLEHIYKWLVKGMRIPKNELQFHEDCWAGGGNMGPSMEYFSRGLEIGNQVYMQYDIKNGRPKELDIKVLDMGMGQERPAWFTCATKTSYEAVFPTVVKKLYLSTGISPDEDLLEKFLPYSGILNIDENDDLEKTWAFIAGKLGLSTMALKDEILPLGAIYSLGDHTRSLLLALSDGAIPSNVGGGYNLRALLRRSLDFVFKYEWDISLGDLCKWHADYLRPQYPELKENLDEVRDILDVEKKKYASTKLKSSRTVTRLRDKKVTLDKLIELYDSNGISPEMLVEEGLPVDIPSDFYTKVAERHEKKEQIAQTRKEVDLDLTNIENTKILYYEDYSKLNFEGVVLKVLKGKYVILNQTAFYPTSGGQLHDIGDLNGSDVEDVFKQGKIIVHVVKDPSFRVGDHVKGKIDKARRKQLAQHHTATHILNGAVKSILGKHIWQAGAEKTLDKARLDVTHYESISRKVLKEIEDHANHIINKNFTVESKIYSRDEAESKFGFRLYQGGAVPGKELRVVKIKDVDIEACGGTHLNSTEEVLGLKLIGTTKIQDGVVRLEYVAGGAARSYEERTRKMLNDIVVHFKDFSVLDKHFAFKIEVPSNFRELEDEMYQCAEVFSIASDQLNITLQRFVNEIIVEHDEIVRRSEQLGLVDGFEIELTLNLPLHRISLLKFCQQVFRAWKDGKKNLNLLRKKDAKEKVKDLENKFSKCGEYSILVTEIETDREETFRTSKNLAGNKRIVILFGIDGRISVVGSSDSKAPVNMSHLVKETCKILGGGGGGNKDFAQGAGFNKNKLGDAKKWVKEQIEAKLIQ
jgi:alanyl-tRNA synthetase|tara:strand:+ start:1811 stop:4771 length:2961 start_codon:yes stop_codon:yes gene_type:complete